MGTETYYISVKLSRVFLLKSFKPRMGTETMLFLQDYQNIYKLKSFKPRMGTETYFLFLVRFLLFY